MAHVTGKKMKYYPLFLDITNRHCVVIGGGKVAERKVLRLLNCGARVTVISPHLTVALEALYRAGKIEVLRQTYDPTLLKGAFLAIAATCDSEINEQIFRDSRHENVLVNIVDDPKRCDFILPSILERGNLSIAISTAGKSPTLARKIRQELAEKFGPEYATLLEILGNIRERYRELEPDEQKRRKTYGRLLDSDLLEAIRDKRWDRVEEIIKTHTSVNIKWRDKNGEKH